MLDVSQRSWCFAALLALGASLSGCYGQGGACTEDEAPGVMEDAKDLGTLTPTLTAVRGELLAQGILQWAEDEDWYRFTVKDGWFVRWRPKISLVVLPAPGSGIVEASYAVNIYTEDGIFVGNAAQGLTLKGTAFFDDTRPYYAQVRWRRPARIAPSEDTPTSSPSSSPSPSPTPSLGDATPSPSPSESPSSTASPSPAPELGESCSRYILRIRN